MDNDLGDGAIALVADMVFASRIRGVAALVGTPVMTVGTPEALLQKVREQKPQLILIDLDARVGDAPALIADLKADSDLRRIRVIAFGSHLERDTLKAAQSAGADRVLARSAFVRELQALLKGLGRTG